jgi:hypothetical protein
VVDLQQPADTELREWLLLKNAAALGLLATLAAVGACTAGSSLLPVLRTRRHAAAERTLAAALRAAGASSQPRGGQQAQSPATGTAEPLPGGVWCAPHCLLAEAAIDALTAERRDPFLQLTAMERDALAGRAAGWPRALGAFGVRHRGSAARPSAAPRPRPCSGTGQVNYLQN